MPDKSCETYNILAPNFCFRKIGTPKEAIYRYELSRSERLTEKKTSDVLLFGFEPYLEFKENPSQIIVKSLDGNRVGEKTGKRRSFAGSLQRVRVEDRLRARSPKAATRTQYRRCSRTEQGNSRKNRDKSEAPDGSR